MKKLKLETLEIESFPTTEVAEEKPGTVKAHEWSMADCSYDLECGVNSRWDCSIDFCSHGGGCGPTIVYTQY